MKGLMDLMQFAGSDDAQNIGKKVGSFSDEVIQLLREIRDNTAAIRAKLEDDSDGR